MKSLAVARPKLFTEYLSAEVGLNHFTLRRNHINRIDMAPGDLYITRNGSTYHIGFDDLPNAIDKFKLITGDYQSSFEQKYNRYKANAALLGYA